MKRFNSKRKKKMPALILAIVVSITTVPVISSAIDGVTVYKGDKHALRNFADGVRRRLEVFVRVC